MLPFQCKLFLYVLLALSMIVPAQASDRTGAENVDIAPFARVVTSDPNRVKGTAANRIEEIPAADVLLDTALPVDAAGGYRVPVRLGTMGCIGLRWPESRFLRRLEALHWADPTSVPPAGAVQLQYWDDDSPWQGQWTTLPTKPETSPNMWSWQLADKDLPRPTYRVRWLFPASDKPLLLKKISAYSRSAWAAADLHIELQQPTAAGRPVQIVVSNGKLLNLAGQDVSKTCPWNASGPLEVRVCYSKPQPEYGKSDRTVLRFELPEQPISVAVEDVVAHGCVYVPCAGLFVTVNPPQITLTQYLQQIAGRKTVLEQVREHPDQTFAQAMAQTHNPIQNDGPMMLSLACDSQKFIVERDGKVRPERWAAARYTLTPQFGSGKGTVKRHLDGGWLPKPTIIVADSGVNYRQCVYVAPVDEKAPEGCPNWCRLRPVFTAEFTIENTRAIESEVSLRLTLSRSDGKPGRVFDTLQDVPKGVLAVSGDYVLALFDAEQSAALSLAKRTDGVSMTGKLGAGKSARFVVYSPVCPWGVKCAEYAVLRDPGHWAAQTERYWKDRLAGAMQIDIPEPELANVIRASQVHCMLAARNNGSAAFVVPSIASDDYGAWDSEAQAVIRGMDMCGQTDFARLGLEFYLKRYNAQGFLTTGYTMVGTGENLWTIAEHVGRCGDREWLNIIAPQLVRTCRWIIAQRAKTKGFDGDGDKLPEYGLMPPGVTADWHRYAYRFFNDAQYCHGLEAIAQTLTQMGYPDAPALVDEARQYRDDLLRAYRWTAARCPVVPLGNGTWVPNHPAMVDVFGNVEDMIPSAEDHNRTWIYSVEIGSHHLAANRLLDPLAPQVAHMMDYLENHQFLRSGWGDYPEQENRKDIFNFGGFGKCQPYYGRTTEIYALRDDVKPFLRSYFNALSALLNEENLSLWEHFHNQGAWNKTHETGWFLCQTALMFAMERGDELWLAPMVTNRWLEDGMRIKVSNIPTRFGRVSYTITSAVARGWIDATVIPPDRALPTRIVIRIRHPEGKPIKTVTVNGRPHKDFDSRGEYVSIPVSREPMTVRVSY